MDFGRLPFVAEIRAHIFKREDQALRSRVAIPGRITKRDLILAMFGGIAVIAIPTHQSYARLLKGHAGVVPPSGIPDVGPSGGWNGTAGTGFGGGHLAEPTPSAPRAITDPVRPSMGEFCNLRTNSTDEVLGFQAGFKGKSGGAQGLQKCQVIIEGLAFDVPNRTTFTYPDPFDQTFATNLTNFLWHFKVKASLVYAVNAAGGTLKYYLKAIANDGGADALIMGPYYFTMKTGLVAAPWGGPATYDALYTCDTGAPIAGNNYHNVDKAMNAAAIAGKTSALVSCPNDGAYPSSTGVASGPTHATQWITIAADPRTCVTGIWMDNHAGSDSNFGWEPGYDGIRFLGGLTILDPTTVGTVNLGGGHVSGWGIITCGISSATNNQQSMCWEGCTWANSGGPTSPDVHGWNGVAGAGAMYNGYEQGGQTIGQVVTNRYVLDCHLNGLIYGILGTSASDALAYGGIAGAHARNCLLHNVYKPHQNVRNSYNCTVTTTGIWNSPNTVPLPAFSLYYSGAGAPTMQTVGGDGAATGFNMFVNTVQDGSTVDLTQVYTESLTDIVTHINTHTNWHAVWLATTPQVSRSQQTLWSGTQPTTPNNSGIGAGAPGSGFDVPLAVSTSAGSPTIIYTMTDPHVDMMTWNGISTTVFQNFISEGYSVYGKRGGQTYFFVTAQSMLDFYLEGLVSSDDTIVLGSSFVSAGGSNSTIQCPQSNVVFINNTITGHAGCILEFWGPTHPSPPAPPPNDTNYQADIYCGVFDTFVESVAIDTFASMTGCQLAGIATRSASVVTGGDSNCFTVGAGFAYGSLFMDVFGTSPYGWGGAGSAPNLTPKTASILKQPISNLISGAYNVDGTRKTG